MAGTPAIWCSIDFKDDIALLGADDIGDVSRFHGESLVFKFFRQFAALERAERAAVGGGRTVGIFLGDVFEAGAVANLLQDIVGFGLGGA